ncbi:MAG: DUF2335 domain-containing protein, partial [Mailhella sp.]
MNARQSKAPQVKPVHAKAIQAQETTSLHMVSSHSGPLPSAHEFALYEKTRPGSADAILRMAETEQLHRHKAENDIISAERDEAKSNHQENMLAYWLAFIVVMAFLVAGFTLTLKGHDWVGGIMMGTSMVGVIGSFLNKKSKA